jgi:hypothetical protein
MESERRALHTVGKRSGVRHNSNEANHESFVNGVMLAPVDCIRQLADIALAQSLEHTVPQQMDNAPPFLERRENLGRDCVED